MSLSLEQWTLVVEMASCYSDIYSSVLSDLEIDPNDIEEAMNTQYEKVCDNVFGDDEEKYVKQYLTWAVKEIMNAQ